MKKVILYPLIGFLACFVILTGCMREEKMGKKPAERVINRYKCPMGCTEEIFDTPGKCPNCGSELLKITES